MNAPNDIDFRRIRPLGGGKDEGFEEFCCQLARRDPDVPGGGDFRRFRGAGGDGGVECVWRFPDGHEWGWQAKYFFDLDRGQLDRSVEAALNVHPGLTRYVICIPFDLTGPRRGQGGRITTSQDDRFEEFKREWERMAAARNMQVQFVLWQRSELIDRLLAVDPSLGRVRYWFDAEILSDAWFLSRLEHAAEAARPRYTPALSVDVPISEAFEALGRTARWKSTVAALANRVSKAAEDWADTYSGGTSIGGPEAVAFPQSHRSTAERLTTKLFALHTELDRLTSGVDTQSLLEIISAASTDAHACLIAVTDAFGERHDIRTLDSAPWRQWMTEYQVSFPALHVDRAREVIEALNEVREWLSGPLGQLPDAPALLVTGPAGVGKTHAIIDIALDRHWRGLRSVVLLGEQFSGGDPWPQIRELLGLPGDLARDMLLASLEAAGEATGYPCIFFIDGLNETQPRRMWHTHLVRVVSAISDLQWVKLCVSCRSTYLDDVLAPNVSLPQVEHTGFEGVEFDAFREYFSFYRIESPATPLMQPEFTNPLFLRLVCESLHDRNMTRLPDGMLGITAVLDYLLAAKNEKLAAELDYHPREELVPRAMHVLVGEMAARQSRWLPWADAKASVEAILPSASRSTSLFDALIRENVLAEDRALEPASGQVVDVIRFAFERMADHLIVHDLLDAMPGTIQDAFIPGGALHFIASDPAALRRHGGLLEALAIQVPERYGIELTAAIPKDWARRALLTAVVDSLIWRASSSVGEETRTLLQEVIENPDIRSRALEALLAVGTRVGNASNADWFHEILSASPMPVRDGWLCPFLHFTYGTNKGVDRLIRWARQGSLDSLNRDVTSLWLTLLAWFCAAADRRVRDHATMAMVRLLEVMPALCVDVLARFGGVDDEYVTERCFAACYGALIRSGDNGAIEEVARSLAPLFDGGRLPTNAMIRDYARCMMEVADTRGVLPDGTTIDRFRPPYGSAWPLEWPDLESMEPYKDSQEDLPKLRFSCMTDDFAVYIVRHALDDYEGVDLEAARRWIFHHVLAMGYGPGPLARYDRYMLGKYGGGRGRPTWAERIGKKYQWIALYHLIAHVADNLPVKIDDWSAPPSSAPLQALGERNIDPTVLVQAEQESERSAWWFPAEYDFSRFEGMSDEEWIETGEWPDSAAMLAISEPGTAAEWLVLHANRTWTLRGEGRYAMPARTVWMHVRSFLIPTNRVDECLEWLADAQVVSGEPGYLSFHEGFAGEYPWATPFVHFIEGAEREGPGNTPLAAFGIEETAAWLGPEHEGDSYHEGTIRRMVPAPVLFADRSLSWDGISGYRLPGGESVMRDPSLTAPGPSALLGRSDFMSSVLAARDVALLWIVTAEKWCSELSTAPRKYMEYTRAHLLRDGAWTHVAGVIGPRERRDARIVSETRNLQPVHPLVRLAEDIWFMIRDGPLSRAEITARLPSEAPARDVRTVLRVLRTQGYIAFTLPEKPSSPRQRYRIVEREPQSTTSEEQAGSPDE